MGRRSHGADELATCRGWPAKVPRPDRRRRPRGRRLRIGEAARAVGVSPSALRRWEHEGLVQPSRSRGRYRLYSQADVARLQQIQRMRTEERVNAPGIRRLLGSGTAAGPREAVMDGAALRDLRGPTDSR